MKVLMIGNFSDKQTADYIATSFGAVGVPILKAIDTGRMPKEFTPLEIQEKVYNEVVALNWVPDIVLVLKELELKLSTYKKLRELYPETIFINWFFDKYLMDKPIWETEQYFEVIKFFDFYFCSLKGVADKLIKKGLPNVYYLDEGCHIPAHGEKYLNNFQKKKYGADVAFVGTIGFLLQHADRIKMLERVAIEGFDLKVWGNRIVDMRLIPPVLRNSLTNTPVINEKHSYVAQSSLVNLGLDQDTTIDMGHSARLYRVLCAGGCYLSTATKGLDTMFKTNARGGEITKDLELVVFYGPEDLVEKLDFLLEHDDIRESIGKNGQKAVLEKHTFINRLEEMLKIINKEMN